MNSFKIIMIGPSGVGKSTLKKVFFERESPLKLIEKTIEPTYGIESNSYDFANTVVIHELAGQQLNEWLTTSTEIYEGTDLVLLILDSRDQWEFNVNLIEQVNKIRLELCPNAFLGILFHKTDLLQSEDRDEISQNIVKKFADSKGILGCMTSISKEFYPETLKNLVKILKGAFMNQKGDQMKSVFLKIDILTQFIDKNDLNLQELFISNNATVEEMAKTLEDLNNEGFIFIKDMMSPIELSKRGQAVIKDLKDNLIIKIQQQLIADYEILNAIIISDDAGKPFFIFENKKDFIKNLVTNVEANADPTLITMFFTAIKSFSLTLNKDGVDANHLKGNNIQIICIDYQDIFALFFINSITINNGTYKLLRDFLREIYEQFPEDIKNFIISGHLKNSNKIQDIIVEKIKRLNDLFQQIYSLEPNITTETLETIKTHIKQLESNPALQDEIKKLLVYYILTKDPSMLKQM